MKRTTSTISARHHRSKKRGRVLVLVGLAPLLILVDAVRELLDLGSDPLARSLEGG
jgi:hypothetical protein